MTKQEWKNRCADRLRALGYDRWLADLHAQQLAECEAELNGKSGQAWVDPEDAADESAAEEMPE